MTCDYPLLILLLLIMYYKSFVRGEDLNEVGLIILLLIVIPSRYLVHTFLEKFVPVCSGNSYLILFLFTYQRVALSLPADILIKVIS